MQDIPTEILHTVLVYYADEYRPLWRHICQSWCHMDVSFRANPTEAQPNVKVVARVDPCTMWTEHHDNIGLHDEGSVVHEITFPPCDFDGPIVQDPLPKQIRHVRMHKDRIYNSIVSVTTDMDGSETTRVDCSLSGITVSQIACRGQYGILRWIYRLKHAFWGSHGELDNIIIAAARGGHVDLLPRLAKWSIICNDSKCWREAMHAAACAGHEAVVRLCRDRFNAKEIHKAVVYAAQYGHLHLVKVLQTEYGADFNMNAVKRAVMNGHLHIVQYYNAQAGGPTWPDEVHLMLLAAKYGHLPVLQWVLQRSLQRHFDADVFPIRLLLEMATENGHIDVIVWILNAPECAHIRDGHLQNDSIADLVEIAVRHDQVDAVRIYTSLPEFNFMLMSSTAVSNYVGMAASMGYMEMFRYAYDMLQHVSVEQRQQHINSALQGAATKGHLNMVRMLVEQCHANAIDLAMYYAARSGHINIVRLCREKYGATCVHDAMNIAAQHGYYEIVLLCRDMYNAHGVDSILTEAAWNNNLKLIKLICLRRPLHLLQNMDQQTYQHSHAEQRQMHTTTNNDPFVSFDAIVRALLNSLRRNSKDVAQYLYKQFCSRQERDDAEEYVGLRGTPHEKQLLVQWCL